MIRCVVLAGILLFLLGLTACSHTTVPAAQESPQYDRVSPSTGVPPITVVHGSFTLGKVQKFVFDVPPHIIAPKVRGQFSSSIGAPDGSRISDESSDVEMMVMTDAQFDDFTHQRSAQSVDAIEPSHNHAVSISLPGTQDDPAHYVVVFRRAAESKVPIAVKAEITAEFDSSM